MRWKEKQYKPKTYPTIGNEKVCRKLLLLPECINREWRWLELVKIRYVYKSWREYAGRGFMTTSGWQPIEWIDIKSKE